MVDVTLLAVIVVIPGVLSGLAYFEIRTGRVPPPGTF
jgi:hypothetical protein